MDFYLGCPTLRRYDLLVGMIRSAAAGTRVPFRCVVVDNGGTLLESKAPEWLAVFGDGPPRMFVETPGENLGCARSWNMLAKKLLVEDDDMLLLANDDILFERDTIEQMFVAMKDGAEFVTATPSGFSCFLVCRKLFEKVGYFDEQFWPAYYEDNDFHRRIVLNGQVRVECVPARWQHVNKGSQTVASFTHEERITHNARFEANRARYVAKWGGLPGGEQFDEPYNGLYQQEGGERAP